MRIFASIALSLIATFCVIATLKAEPAPGAVTVRNPETLLDTDAVGSVVTITVDTDFAGVGIVLRGGKVVTVSDLVMNAIVPTDGRAHVIGIIGSTCHATALAIDQKHGFALLQMRGVSIPQPAYVDMRGTMVRGDDVIVCRDVHGASSEVTVAAMRVRYAKRYAANATFGHSGKAEREGACGIFDARSHALKALLTFSDSSPTKGRAAITPAATALRPFLRR